MLEKNPELEGGLFAAHQCSDGEEKSGRRRLSAHVRHDARRGVSFRWVNCEAKREAFGELYPFGLLALLTIRCRECPP
jgi:hypothetical protein